MGGDIVFISIGKLAIASFLGLKPESAFLVFAIVLFILVLVGTYLIINSYKKYFDNKLSSLEAQIENSFKQKNEKLSSEVKALKEKLENDGKEWSEWKPRIDKLVLEIEDLKKQILEIGQKGIEPKKDVIIEYYMKDDES